MAQPQSEPVITGVRLFAPQVILTLAGLVIVLALAGTFAVKPAYAWWVGKSARELTEKANAAIELEHYDQASQLLIRAYKKVPSDPSVLRAIARLLSLPINLQKGDSDRAVYFWKQLIATGTATLDDRMQMGLSLVASGNPDDAQKLLEEVPPSESCRLLVKELQAELLRYEGHKVQADQILRTALAAEPENDDCKLRLAILELKNPFRATREAAMASLWKLARNGGVQGVHAVDALAGIPELTSGDLAELRQLVGKNPGNSERHRFLVLSAWIKAHPEDKEKVIRDEWTAHERSPEADLPDFMRWIRGLNEHKLILSLMKPGQAARSPEHFHLYSDALCGEKRWGELNHLLSSSPVLPIPHADAALLRVRCSHGLKEAPTVVRGQLTDAVKAAAAEKNLVAIEKAALLAEGFGHEDLAIDSLRNLSGNKQYRLPMLEHILAIQTRHLAGSDALATLKEILDLRPGLNPYANTSLYLRLLLGKDMERAMLQADEVKQPEGDFSDASALTLVQALVAYRRLDVARAREIAQDINPAHLPPGLRAVLAGILKAGGDTTKAFTIAEKVPSSLLLREELEFLNKAL